MADDIPHDDAPLEVPMLPSAAEVEEPVIDEIDGTIEDIAADIATEEIYPLGPELELLPL